MYSLRSLRLQNIISLLKIMKERQVVMDLCTIFAHKVKIGCTLDEKQMEMQTLDKEEDATREKGIYRVTVVGSVVNFLLASVQVLCRHRGAQCRHAGGCRTFVIGLCYRHHCHCFCAHLFQSRKMRDTITDMANTRLWQLPLSV